MESGADPTWKVFSEQRCHGDHLSKYHLEAGIAYWHTQKADTPEKWKSIIDLYNSLLSIQHSPIADLNRAFAISKANGKNAGILEAEKLDLSDNQFYHSLLGNLYTGVDDAKALKHYEEAFRLANSTADKTTIQKSIAKLRHR